ncbi:MAG: ZIP family metal transporter [Candidatus Woesearchaeota archaeon]|jgi:zinc and cadmium transporter
MLGSLEIWLYSIISVLVVSSISLIGLITLALSDKTLDRILFLMVAFSVGALLGDAFIHILPEAQEEINSTLIVGLFVLIGILLFFVVEKVIHWRHCHHQTTKTHPHPYAMMNMIGDSFHNFLDGMIIGASYMVSIPIGIATTIAVILHEIPQEIGDFGVLLHGGFSKKKALLMNFLTALTAILGAVIVLLIGNKVEMFSLYILPITAGGFIYIAASDLIPEMHKETKISRSLLQLLMILLGVGVMALMLFFE